MTSNVWETRFLVSYIFLMGVIILSSWTQSQCMCVKGDLPHNLKQFSDTSRVCENLNQFGHRLPRDSVRFHRLRVQCYNTITPATYTHTSDASGKPRMPPVLNFRQRNNQFVRNWQDKQRNLGFGFPISQESRQSFGLG